MSDVCKICASWPTNVELNEVNLLDTDIHIKIDPRGAMHCRHYDHEGNTDDDRITFPINFCPVCGRDLKK